LFVNTSGLSADIRCSLPELTRNDAKEAEVFDWKPGRFSRSGRLTELSLRLNPHASRLFYLSTDPKPPESGMTIFGN
jgi:hypothetical protein